MSITKRQTTTIKITTDDRAIVYLDGLKVLDTNTFITYYLRINTTSNVIAISVTNVMERIGIMVETTSGVITDKSWRCTEKEPRSNWATKDFNDSSWPNSIIHAINRDGYKLMPPNPKFSFDSVWISGFNIYATKMYCRQKLAK